MNEVSVSQQLARRDRHFLHTGNNPERANAAQAPAPSWGKSPDPFYAVFGLTACLNERPPGCDIEISGLLGHQVVVPFFDLGHLKSFSEPSAPCRALPGAAGHGMLEA